MKLEQAQVKKIGISLGILGAVLYGYIAFLLGPLKAGEKNALSGIESLEPQIDDAKKQIAAADELEKKAPDALALLNNLKDTIPDGAPIAWFPPKMAAFFKSCGIEKCATHLLSESPDTMPGFKRIVWTIDLPRVEFIPLGVAISNLENREPLLSIYTVEIDAARDDTKYQRATLIVATLVKS